ncbi:DJ-1/PfpI family protein [Brevibacterium sp.]|jgi:transcriptional regulator GlxA family with amidase domain|uniref:GlxA family transcriptional regulator n=1 Tax=Brevibacterium sp. TaxID=1701 RepID=UPI00260D6D02|nr:DJ-1/PfpI family protein [Brevibacterium sp.]
MSDESRTPQRRAPRSRPHRILVLALDGVSAMDLGVPVQVFGAESNSAVPPAPAATSAAAVAPVPGDPSTAPAAAAVSPAPAAPSAAVAPAAAAVPPGAAASPVPAGIWPYEVEVCGITAGAVTGSDGLDYSVDHGLEALTSADTIILPGATSAVVEEPPAAVIGALLSAFERGTRIAAISTGTFVLARTGLLGGRRATTHWSTAKELGRRFPAIEVDENVLFIDEGQLLTSAGAASAIDLCLHLIRSDHGVGLSNQVARRLVAAAYRSAGQAQYVPRSVPDPLGDDFADTREWALQHIGEKLTLRDLAANAGVSVRTFSRRFVEDTGYTPMQWVLRARVDLARELLENSDLGIEQIADQVGLGTGANLRMHFHRILSTSPNDYRHSFQG